MELDGSSPGEARLPLRAPDFASDGAPFVRAFRGWVGVAPGRYRLEEP